MGSSRGFPCIRFVPASIELFGGARTLRNQRLRTASTLALANRLAKLDQQKARP